MAIRIMGAISMIHPSTSKIRLISKAIKIGFLVSPMIAFAAMSGTWSVVNQYPNTFDVAIRISTIASVSTHFSSVCQTPFHVKPL